MTRFVLLAAFAISSASLIGCVAEPASEDDAASSDDALRRYDDAKTERPEVGLVRFPTSYCTGTLIGPRTVLTAAHCVQFGSGASATPAGTFQIDRPDGTRVKFPFSRWRADANVLQVKFDLAILQLDAPVPANIATPATIAADWPGERLTVYGYGRYGTTCSQTDATPTKRKTTTPSNFPFVKATTCPGDSGGPYFRGTSNEIVATVKGDGLGLEWVGDAVSHRTWILARRGESEAGALALE